MSTRVRIAALIMAGMLVYWNALPAPLFLDDSAAVVGNETIRQLWPLPGPLAPPHDTPIAGRPLVNLTFAVNYALGGLNPRGYRATNLAIHLLAALVFFGIVRRTLELRSLAPLFGASAADVAWIAALVWMLHPLNTEVVDYVTERSESLMGLAYLLSLYCAIRAYGGDGPAIEPAGRRPRSRQASAPKTRHRSGGWGAAAVACCAAGMLSKESMVTAPVAIVLYDRVFLFDSFVDAARRRGRLYAGLGATLLLLAAILWSAPRSSVGFAAGVSPVTYLLNQIVLIPHYLYLVIWPHALVVDYGLPRMLAWRDVMLPGMALTVIIAAGIVFFVRAPRLGFGLAWFLLTLAPTSSLVPIVTEVGAERRMYLPLAGLVAMAVTGAYLLLRRAPRRMRVAAATAVCMLAAAGTYLRNREYASPLVLARTVVDRWPSGRGHFFYGTQLMEAGRTDEGVAQFRLSAADYPGGQYALGVELVGAGQIDEGLAHLRQFIQMAPADTAVLPAHDLIGRVLISRGQFDAAADQFTSILASDPRNVRALVLLGDVRLRQGRTDDAIRAYQNARQVDPTVGGDVSVLGRLGAALATMHRLDEAVEATGQAVALRPDDEELQKLLGRVLAMSGRLPEAVQRFRRAVQLAPNDPQARAFLDAAEREAAR